MRWIGVPFVWTGWLDFDPGITKRESKVKAGQGGGPSLKKTGPMAEADRTCAEPCGQGETKPAAQTESFPQAGRLLLLSTVVLYISCL